MSIYVIRDANHPIVPHFTSGFCGNLNCLFEFVLWFVLLQFGGVRGGDRVVVGIITKYTISAVQH